MSTLILVLTKAAQMIASLTFLVGVHELGHMLAAKWFGMRVERFSIGFPPRLFGKKIGETDYQIGAIPLGGYVKISGMIDESLDTEALKNEPQPWEFRAKPAWQRLIVMLGGIFVNVVTGIVIFILLTWSYGESYLPASEARFGVVTSELGREIGFRDGDQVVAVNGKPVDAFDDIHSPEALLGDHTTYTVKRNGTLLQLPIPPGIVDKLAKREELFVTPALPFAVEEVLPGQPAAKAGLRPNDRIRAVDNQPIRFFHELQKELKERSGKTVTLTVARGTEVLKLPVQVEQEGTVGFRMKPLLHFSTRYFTLAQAIPVGTHQAFNVIALNLKVFGKIFKGEASATNTLSGPIGIAQQFGVDWVTFWRLTGMLSMVLAFMNLLPIPALDGGHAVFLIYEVVAGHKPSERFLENAQKVGMLMLLSLMVFAFGNDIYRVVLRVLGA